MIPKVTRWGPFIEPQLRAKGYPWPVELIYTLMFRESRGNAGVTNKSSGASGLLQVMPNTLTWYNDKTGDNVSLATMRTNSENAGDEQIKVGLWVLATFWRSAYRWLTRKNQTDDIPLDDMVRFADAFYAAGPGTVQKMGNRLPKATWANWMARYPDSNINPHANGVWLGTQEQNPRWDLDRISTWLRGTIDPDDGGDTDDTGDSDDAMGGLILGLGVILVAWLWMSKGKK